MMLQSPQTHNTEQYMYDNDGKDWYFLFDDDKNMGYKYILSITYTWMGRLNTRDPIYCKS